MAKMFSPHETQTSAVFPVVCIGGSAGGLRAYKDILGQMPLNAGLAIVIVSHRAIDDADRLVQLLSKMTHMEVVEVTDEVLLEPGFIYVTPPQREITTDGVVLKLAATQTKYQGWPTVISGFLFSLASTCSSRAIAIIVSGMGHDGSGALSAIKENGGCTLAQSDPEFLGMPQAAVDTNHVDFVLRSKEIGSYLASLSEHLRMAADAR
jgi:two-component system CheB/CheR fusion protein